MNKVIIYTLLFLEVVGIFALNMKVARHNADHCSSLIEIPDGTLLTINRDITLKINNEDVFIPKGTMIIPQSIRANVISFFYDETGERLDTSWDSIKEQNVLENLRESAEIRRRDHQQRFIMKGAFTGVAEGIGWLIVGGILNYWFIRNNRYKALMIIHAFVSIVIVVLLVSAILLYT